MLSRELEDLASAALAVATTGNYSADEVLRHCRTIEDASRSGGERGVMARLFGAGASLARDWEEAHPDRVASTQTRSGGRGGGWRRSWRF